MSLLCQRQPSLGPNKIGWERVPNNADIDSRESLQLGAAMLESLSAHTGQELPPPPSSPGAQLEEAVRVDLAQELEARDGSRRRQPHLVAVTAEPLPTRLAAIARGTGEVDAVYHIAYDELHAAVRASNNTGQQAAWAEITGQGRLLNYNLLGEHLASW